jgi:hypothetical protein
MSKLLAVITILLLGMAVGGTQGISTAMGSNGLVVHEWGTFTAVAGEDGRPVVWLPQAGPTDLPDFIDRIDCRIKRSLSGTVRMETPVIYFYAPQEMTVSVRVQFRQGFITEWFPRPVGVGRDAMVNDAFAGHIAWNSVKVRPHGEAKFPVEAGKSHYYVARQTDSAPIQSGGEHERFLFYRGVGRLVPPIGATVGPAGHIVATNTRQDALGDLMLFENRDGAIAYQAATVVDGTFTFNRLEPMEESASPHADLERMLVAHGLYPKEARAMVESWRSSWFEEGTRLFYIVSNDVVDALLPLQVDPAPSSVVRVFVGRLEIVTPHALDAVERALATTDSAALARYGRFLQPIGQRLASRLAPTERAALGKRLEAAAAPWTSSATTCSAISRRY